MGRIAWIYDENFDSPLSSRVLVYNGRRKIFKSLLLELWLCQIQMTFGVGYGTRPYVYNDFMFHRCASGGSVPRLCSSAAGSGRPKLITQVVRITSAALSSPHFGSPQVRASRCLYVVALSCSIWGCLIILPISLSLLLAFLGFIIIFSIGSLSVEATLQFREWVYFELYVSVRCFKR